MDHKTFHPKAPRVLLCFYTWVGKPSNFLHGSKFWSICTTQVMLCHAVAFLMFNFLSSFFSFHPGVLFGEIQSFQAMTFHLGVWWQYLKNFEVEEGSLGMPRQLILWPVLGHRETYKTEFHHFKRKLARTIGWNYVGTSVCTVPIVHLLP